MDTQTNNNSATTTSTLPAAPAGLDVPKFFESTEAIINARIKEVFDARLGAAAEDLSKARAELQIKDVQLKDAVAKLDVIEAAKKAAEERGFVAKTVSGVKEAPAGSIAVLIVGGVAIGVGSTLAVQYGMRKWGDTSEAPVEAV